MGNSGLLFLFHQAQQVGGNAGPGLVQVEGDHAHRVPAQRVAHVHGRCGRGIRFSRAGPGRVKQDALQGLALTAGLTSCESKSTESTTVEAPAAGSETSTTTTSTDSSSTVAPAADATAPAAGATTTDAAGSTTTGAATTTGASTTTTTTEQK